MSVEDRHEGLLTKWASLKSRERHRSRRVTATLIATCLAGFALIVQAPVAGASNHAAKRMPAVGIAPFAGDVFTTDSNNNLTSSAAEARAIGRVRSLLFGVAIVS
jgi:hypothetical protein